MRKAILSVCFLSAAALALPGLATTNALTYVATLGRYADGKVEPYPVTNDVTVTVSLYPSETSTAALWSRRFTTYAYDGEFAVELSDDAGVAVLDRPVTYARLDQLFAGVGAETAYWVEISDVTCQGVPLPGAATGALQRGKITGVPFAVTAEKAVAANGDFTVNGKATVGILKASGRVTARQTVTFGGTAAFAAPVTLAAATSTVTGQVSKATLDGIGTLAADAVTASESTTVNTFVVTGGAATILTPKDGALASLTELEATGDVAAPKGVTVGSLGGTADTELTVAGDVSIPSNGSIVWDREGTLSIPNGIYAADDDNANIQGPYTKSSWSWTNGTGLDCLVSSTHAATGTVKVKDKDSAKVGGDSCVVTTILPVAPGESFTISSGILTFSQKELSK